MGKKSIYIILTVLLVVILIIIGVTKHQPKKIQPVSVEKPVAVTTEPVIITTMNNWTVLNGKIKPIQEADISPKISGIVRKIYFELGQKVKQGDLLLKLDDRDLQLKLKQAEAALKETATALDSSLLTAETNYNDAMRKYQRKKRLYENQIASKQELEEAESQLKLTEEQFDSAKIAKKNGLTNAQAKLEQAQVACEIAKAQLEYSEVRALINGVVSFKDLNIGMSVTSSSKVAGLIDLSSVIVETSVTESVVNQLQIGDQVEVYVKSVSDQSINGEIIAVAPSVDTSSRNYPLRIKVANAKGLLKSGMFAEIRLSLDELKQVLAIPVDAVFEEDGREYVYLLAEDRANKTLVKTGIVDERLVQVVEGLTEEDVVIVKGLNLLENGAKVMVVE